MAQDELNFKAMQHNMAPLKANNTSPILATPAAKPAPQVERLEYRRPEGATSNGHENGHTNGHPDAAIPDAMSLVEEWLRPMAVEQNGHAAQHAGQADAASLANSASMAEEQWRQERTTLEIRLAEQNAAASRAIAAAREEGRREGRQISEEAFEEERDRMRQHMVETLEEFRLQRERYFHSVEREVVRLALAISARVLHRQAQIDPLFLSGAVRVALEKLADTTGVVLRVAPAQVLAWQEMFRLHSGARVQPEILGDLSLNAGECILETRLGTVELGVKAQLEEIEKGFFDLLHHHPAPNRVSHGLGA